MDEVRKGWWRCVVSTHGGRTSMGAWVSPLLGEEGGEDEEDGRNLVWGVKEEKRKRWRVRD